MAGKTNDTEQKIILLTIDLINEGGVEQISLRNLAKQLGLSTGAFYKHFANKNDLWLVVTKQLSKNMSLELAPILQKKYDSKTKILEIAKVMLLKFQTNPNLMDFLFFNPTSKSDLNLHSTEFNFLKIMNDLVSNLITENKLIIDKQTLFIQLWSFIQGYGLLIRNHATTFDEELVAQTLHQLIKE